MGDDVLRGANIRPATFQERLDLRRADFYNGKFRRDEKSVQQNQSEDAEEFENRVDNIHASAGQ